MLKNHYIKSPNSLKKSTADKHSYGTCQCGQPFRIPGLERSLCSACGWTKTPGYSFHLSADPPPPPPPKQRKSSKVKKSQESNLFGEVQP